MSCMAYELEVELKIDVEKVRQNISEAVKPIYDAMGKKTETKKSGGESGDNILRAIRKFFESGPGGMITSIAKLIGLGGIAGLAVKFSEFSGYMQATLRLLDTFVNLLFKPIADLFGAVLMPMLIPVIKLLAKFLPIWNDVMRKWMQGIGKTGWGGAIELASIGAGFMLGGPVGALVGAFLPMLINWIIKSVDWSRFWQIMIDQIQPLIDEFKMLKIVIGDFIDWLKGLIPDSVKDSVKKAWDAAFNAVKDVAEGAKRAGGYLLSAADREIFAELRGERFVPHSTCPVPGISVENTPSYLTRYEININVDSVDMERLAEVVRNEITAMGDR